MLKGAPLMGPLDLQLGAQEAELHGFLFNLEAGVEQHGNMGNKW